MRRMHKLTQVCYNRQRQRKFSINCCQCIYRNRIRYTRQLPESKSIFAKTVFQQVYIETRFSSYTASLDWDEDLCGRFALEFVLAYRAIIVYLVIHDLKFNKQPCENKYQVADTYLDNYVKRRRSNLNMRIRVLNFHKDSTITL